MTSGDLTKILVNIKDRKDEDVTQCLGWTTDIYLSMVTDTVDLLFKMVKTKHILRLHWPKIKHIGQFYWSSLYHSRQGDKNRQQQHEKDASESVTTKKDTNNIIIWSAAQVKKMLQKLNKEKLNCTILSRSERFVNQTKNKLHHIEPLRDICMSGNSHGNRWGCTQAWMTIILYL